MCGTCGCGEHHSSEENEQTSQTSHGHAHDQAYYQAHDHAHDHAHDQAHDQVHDHGHTYVHDHDHAHNSDHTHAHDHAHAHAHQVDRTLITLEQDILSRNNLLAERNRGYFEAKHLFVLNLMSSPGSGKTTLLEETIRRLKDRHSLYVIEGDQQTSNDADRIAALDIPVFQVNTGSGCHLEAAMVNHAVKHLEPSDGSLLFIENVGNLVCPAMFDLGESKKVVIVSTTEGDDKPLKYPFMFREADVCIINKTDLLPYLNADCDTLRRNALQVNRQLTIFEVSAIQGEGMEAWCDWLATESRKQPL